MNLIKPNVEILNLSNYKKSKNSRFYYTTDDVRIIAYDATKACFDAISAHNLGLIEGKLLSQAMLSALMISETLKNPDDRLNYEIQCSGPIGGINIECKQNGDLRGFVINNPADVKNIVIHTLSDFLGAGFITCQKHIEGLKEDQKSSVMLQSGNIPFDTAYYFKESEQINTTTAMWVNVKDNKFQNVKGLFVQALPNANDKALEKIENIIKTIDLPYFEENMSINNYIEISFNEFKPKFLQQSPINFTCPCSKEHYVKVLKNLKKQNNDIFANEDKLTITCSMCSSQYTITSSEV